MERRREWTLCASLVSLIPDNGQRCIIFQPRQTTPTHCSHNTPSRVTLWVNDVVIEHRSTVERRGPGRIFVDLVVFSAVQKLDVSLLQRVASVPVRWEVQASTARQVSGQDELRKTRVLVQADRVCSCACRDARLTAPASSPASTERTRDLFPFFSRQTSRSNFPYAAEQTGK